VVSRFISDPTETTVNVASGESVSIKELVEIIGDALSVSPTVEDAPTGSRSGSFEFDTTHLNRLIPDFKPTPIKAGIEKLVNS
jgi:nucleoside-diphosphate-sugar epimerase